ncbi:protein C3orf33 homolog isoform X1 [Bufo gargarizans]|uniref:protein C3orf33 homolog isoform X1 n=1 Tax=Bufo gargarizans TaxID=30331 RepID=UPI001CF55754|nr:protein C3orf33 homolog isoform X1 [Bufo gargarizans]
MAPGDGQSADNVIAKASGLLDSHLYILRNISTGLAIAGIVLCARSIRLVTKFTQAKDIPEQFIKKNVKLRGKVVCVTEETIEIDHIPISLPVLRSVQKKWHGQGSLLVRLAGVELTQDGKIWLQNNLQPSEMLWFQLLNREDSMLDCFVFINRGGFINDCLNVVLLKEGLGRTAHIRGVHQGPGHHLAFYKRLLQAEIKAQKARKGLWKRESQMNILTNAVLRNSIIQHVKQFFSLMTKYWKKFRS